MTSYPSARIYGTVEFKDDAAGRWAIPRLDAFTMIWDVGISRHFSCKRVPDVSISLPRQDQKLQYNETVSMCTFIATACTRLKSFLLHAFRPPFCPGVIARYERSIIFRLPVLVSPRKYVELVGRDSYLEPRAIYRILSRSQNFRGKTLAGGATP